jgi:hypothetical protein
MRVFLSYVQGEKQKGLNPEQEHGPLIYQLPSMVSSGVSDNPNFYITGTKF